ncbi:hypothetical protein [Rhodococcus sp. P1Y]|uniref:hypothetical protein n=1 Tax=Rhodococcus sp. P1Y TaxID=1302308 RepID=UPI001293259A|nr:hypothetical protein [Rhodococcus sp. P1Y]
MTTFIALASILVFVHIGMITYARHASSAAVRKLWASPYRYDFFRPADPCN